MLQEIKKELTKFLKGQSPKIQNIPEFKKVCLLNKKDNSVELASEGYIDNKTPTLKEIKQGVEEMIKEAVSFKIKYKEKLEALK